MGYYDRNTTLLHPFYRGEIVKVQKGGLREKGKDINIAPNTGIIWRINEKWKYIT